MQSKEVWFRGGTIGASGNLRLLLPWQRQQCLTAVLQHLELFPQRALLGMGHLYSWSHQKSKLACFETINSKSLYGA